MAYTNISKSSDHFNTKLYSGTGAIQTVSGVGFEPSWIWTKSRTNAGNHKVTDQVRGLTKYNRTNANNAEETHTDSITAVNNDGFVLGADSTNDFNASGQNYVSWNWKANGAGSSNTDGSINTTSTSVNTTAGFSISKYTGTGSVATIGHGLGAVPNMVLVKRLDSSSDWRMYHSGAGAGSPATKQLFLNGTGAQDDDNTIWNDTAPTSSVFTVGTNTGSNASGGTYVAYCFTEKQGFSKFGSYEGNNNADGTFIYTGFKPAFFIWKRISSTGGWYVSDSKRDTFNEVDIVLSANDTGTESDQGTTFDHDFVSNGIKIRNSVAAANSSGGIFVYIAFAEAPLVGSNNVPCTAR